MHILHLGCQRIFRQDNIRLCCNGARRLALRFRSPGIFCFATAQRHVFFVVLVDLAMLLCKPRY